MHKTILPSAETHKISGEIEIKKSPKQWRQDYPDVRGEECDWRDPFEKRIESLRAEGGCPAEIINASISVYENMINAQLIAISIFEEDARPEDAFKIYSLINDRIASGKELLDP